MDESGLAMPGTCAPVAVTPPPQEYRIAVPAIVESLAIARMWIREIAADLPGQRLEDLLLIVSELVANSIAHAARTELDFIDLVTHISPGVVRVSVRDAGAGLPDDWLARAGSGLRLVGRLADRLIAEPGSAVVTVEVRS